MNRREITWLAWTGLALMVLATLPYLVAWAATPDGAHFTGLVFNPQDGHSYLAKMRQGYQGAWRFQLPYTPERSPGAYLFLFHLWLGHFARWTRLPLIGVYHGARILGGIAMLAGIYTLAAHLNPHRQGRATMFLLTSLGSGFGWLAGAAGLQTADLWVPEAFPSYSLMANAHFPLAIALMTGIAVCGLRITHLTAQAADHRVATWPWGFGLLLAALLLGAIQPFGLVPVFGALGVMLAARALRHRREPGNPPPWRAGAWIIAAGAVALAYPVYMQIAIRSDPVLAAWNAENITPSPPAWDWALSYGLLLVLALLGAAAALRRGSDGDLLLLGWVLVTVVGMVLPLPLQRRLSLGLGVAIGLLAGMGWWHSIRPRVPAGGRGFWRGIAIAFSALTTLFLIVLVSFGALSGEPWFYLSAGEWKALAWLRDQTSPGGVVLCAPQTGTFVPAWAGQPVVYGHPFETLDAERRRTQVEAYWRAEMSAAEQQAFLHENRVTYALVGPRERALGRGAAIATRAGTLVFETDGAKVYELSGR